MNGGSARRSVVRARRIFAGALLSLAVFLVLESLVVGGEAMAVDARAKILIDHWRRYAPRPLMKDLSALGSGVLLIPLACGISALAWWRRWRLALFLPGLVGGAVTLDVLVKWLVARARPHSTSYGFPSGHVFLAVVFFGALMYLLACAPLPRLLWWTGATVCLAAVAGVTVSRLALGVHWLTDVAGGLSGGAAYLLVSLLWAEVRRASAG